MKKIVLVIAVVLIGYTANSQNSRFGIKGGLNLATLSGTVNMEPSTKPGLLLGIFIDETVTAKFHIQPELVFSAQGAKIGHLGGPSTGWAVTRESITKLNYINIPVMGKVYLGKVVNLQFGPQLGLLLSAKDSGDNLKDVFKTSDFSLVGGLGLEFPGGVDLSTRLVFGVSDLNRKSGDIVPGIALPALCNNVVQFALGVPFK